MAPALFLQSASSAHEVAPSHANKSLPNATNTNPVGVKRSVVSLPPTARSPPRKIPAIAPFTSLTRTNLLKEALRFGGTSELDVDKGKHFISVTPFECSHEFVVLMESFQSIQFHPIPTRLLSEILENRRYHSFDLELSDSYPGRLRVDQTPGSFIGVGGFKTAQTGLLMLTPPTFLGLGSKAHQDVVIKRPFYTPFQQLAQSSSKAVRAPPPGADKRRIVRFSLADELPKLHCEANTLYWAKALLTMTYDFIDGAIAHSRKLPPFDIPRLRFVEAGLALAHSQPTKAPVKGKSSSTLCGVYLLEEKIEGGSTVFTKFIHNMDCGPSLDEGEEGYGVAQFLAFTQHVQYIQTSKLVFISDYQGK